MTLPKRQITLSASWFKATKLVMLTMAALLLAAAPYTTSYAAPAELEAPVLQKPDNAGWSKTPSVVFEWDEVEDADSYELRYIQQNECTEENLAKPGTFLETSDEATVTINALGDGNWCWQVRAVKDATPEAIKGQWSEIRSLSVDTIAPIITLTQPVKQPDFAGTINTPTATLTAMLDNEQYDDITAVIAPEVNEVGTYNWTVSLANLPEGDHVLVIKAVDPAGNETLTQEVAFTVPPPKLDPSLTQGGTLPLIQTGPLVFNAAPPPPIEQPENTLPAYIPLETASDDTSELITPAQLASVAPAAKTLDAAAPLQASEEGWLLIGVAWYWWVAVAAIITGIWWTISRVRARSGFSSGLNPESQLY